MKCDDDSSPTNSRIDVALHRTGYGNFSVWNGVTYWDWYLKIELLLKNVQSTNLIGSVGDLV